MKPGQLPTSIGRCAHCTHELYDAGPVHRYPDGTVAHVACHADHVRQPRHAPGKCV